jgi:hypothetical protein
MRKRSSSRSDLNQVAASIVARSTGQPLPVVRMKSDKPEKNAAAVALGRLGGLKGGPERVKHTTPAQRKEWALKAAQARWNHRAQ